LGFKNLLLSKTGTLFFIATSSTSFSDIIGKINANGSLNWAKTAPSYTAIESGTTQLFSQTKVDQMLLDRNNNLILTGVNGSTMYFLKVDTLGNLIKLRSLTNNDLIIPSSSKIINDGSGTYMVSSWGDGFEGPVYNLIYRYSDLTDLIVNNSLFSIGYMGNAGQVSVGADIKKSKGNSNTFYLSSAVSAYNNLLSNTVALKKLRDTTLLWDIQFQTSSPYLVGVKNIEEDHLKNTYVSFVSNNINTNQCEIWALKVDSNGICDNTRYNLGQYYRAMPSADTIINLMHHFNNSYFCTIERNSSVSGPLTIIKMDSTIGARCNVTSTINVTSDNNYPKSNSAITITSISSSTMTTMSSTVTSVLNYSVIVNSCLPLGTKEFELNRSISIYPNPTTNKLNINHSENFSIIESSIFDITGKLIAFNNHQTIIDVSKLNSGIYFIKVITDKGEFRQKFIKE
jgi:hypothetical protein